MQYIAHLTLLPAQWMFEAGGVGSLVHGATLQGNRYEANLDIWADGLRMSLEDPYTEQCILRIRKGMKTILHRVVFKYCNCYFTVTTIFGTSK